MRFLPKTAGSRRFSRPIAFRPATCIPRDALFHATLGIAANPGPVPVLAHAVRVDRALAGLALANPGRRTGTASETSSPDRPERRHLRPLVLSPSAKAVWVEWTVLTRAGPQLGC